MRDLLRALGAKPAGERLRRAQNSPQWKGGRFDQGLPLHFDYGALLSRFFLRFRGKRRPDQDLPVVATDPSLFDRPPLSGLRVTWLGHSTALVELEGVRVLLDPMWGPRASPSRSVGPARFYAPPLALPDLPRLDAIVFSHDHYDHLDEMTVTALRGMECPFVAPLGVGAHLEHWGVPAERIMEMDWWEELKLGDLTLACVPARHFSGRGLRRNATLWCGWALLGRERRLFYSGDSSYFDGFRAIGARYGPFDAGLFECGAYDPAWPDVHLGPEQAVQACKDSGARLFIPMHWGTFDLAMHGWTEPVERLLVAARAAGLAVAVPRPGQSLEPSNPPPLERWWPDARWEGAGQTPIRSTGI